MLEPNAMYGNPLRPVYSLRDEPWAEAEPILLEAIADGYIFWATDDAILLSRCSGNLPPEIHVVDPHDQQRSLDWARKNWWVEDMADESEQPELTLADIYRLKAEGRLFAEMEGKHEYILMAFELYPNGTTSDEFVQDPGVAHMIGLATGLGEPTDSMGWAIWEVDKVIDRKATDDH